MTIKDLVESHPVSVLAPIVIVIAGAAAGTVQYFATQTASLQEQRHQRRVADLESRLVSLRIEVGDQEDLLLDITTMQITNSDVPSLPESYSSVDYVGADGNFFVSMPEVGEWRRQSMSELDLVRQRIPDVPVLAFPGDDPRVEENLVVWQPNTDRLDVALRTRTGESVGMSFMPFVAVSKVSHEFLMRAANLGAQMATSEELEDLTRAVDALVAIQGGESRDDNRQAEPDSRAGYGLEIENLLSMYADAFRGDHAAVMLHGKLTLSFASVALLEGRYDLLAIEKKGNVLAMRTLTTLESEGEANGLSTVYLEEQFLYIGVGEHIISVQVFVPSTNLRSDAYAWAHAWLAGLRIVI